MHNLGSVVERHQIYSKRAERQCSKDIIEAASTAVDAICLFILFRK